MTWNEIRDPRFGGSVNPTRVQRALQNAPPPQAYQSFVQTYEGHATAAVTAQEERQEKTQQKEEEKKQKFKEQVVKMIEKVKRGVDSSQRDLVMSFRTQTDRTYGANLVKDDLLLAIFCWFCRPFPSIRGKNADPSKLRKLS